MKLGRAIEMAEYVADPRKTIEVFGMYGDANLGDEAMRTVALEMLPRGRTVAVVKPTRLPLLSQAMTGRRRREIVVGGGTLVHGGGAQGNAWLDHVERRVRDGAQVSFLGTGLSFKEEQLAGREGSAGRWAALFDDARHVGVRGPMSKRMAQRLGARATIFGDAAFGLYDPDLASARDRADDRLIGVNIGGCADDQATYEQVSAGMIAKLAPDFRLRIFVVMPKDLAAAKRTLAASGITPDRYEIVTQYHDAHAFMRSAAECRAFIGLRLHASGLAMVAGVPALLVAYRPKCRDFVLPIELEHALLELPLSIASHERQVEELLLKPERFRATARIDELCSRQKRTVADLFGT